MSPALLIAFILVFAAPIAYQRIHFAWKREDFMKIELRRKSGLQIHHAHWGLIFIIFSLLWLVLLDKNAFIILLAGYGLGLLTDEIIPSLLMPSKDRVLELDVYKRATKPTLILAGAIIVIVGIAGLVIGR